MSAAFEFSTPDLLSLFEVEQCNSREGLAAYLQGLLERCRLWFGAAGASIFLESGRENEFVLVAKSGPIVRTPEGATILLGEGLAGEAIASGQAKIFGDLTSNSKKGRDDISSSMVIPLRTTEQSAKCVGVLNLARSNSEVKFDDRDLALANTIGQHIALAVSNATHLAHSRHLSEMLKAVLAHVGFGVVSINAEGKITHFNPEAALMLGGLPTMGESLEGFVARTETEFALPMTTAAAESLKGKRHRSRHQHHQRIWTIHGTPLPSSGSTLSIQDVTELESAQREYERLRRLAEVGQMTATIAHEIRNPLTGIRSAAKMIADTPELAEEFAEIIEVEAIKLSKLCDEFLEFARPLKLETEVTELIPILKHVATLMQPDFEAAKVDFVLDLDSEPDTLNLDIRRMEQVVRNLLLNAMQATPAGGTVTLATFRAGFSVLDTGCGMDQPTVQRLFSPFFTTKPKGTGLGLSMVRKIIDAHEAHISVQSEPNRGTKFEIRFNQERIA